MKCPNCGAEIGNNTKVCEFCGSALTAEMRKEQERINKAGCPKCGSTNVTFEREKQGEFKGKKETAIIRNTVGVCKDCGHTWTVEGSGANTKKRRTWLWVLGWIFIFPVPLTILMLRPENKLDKKIRYVIIAVAWIAYLFLFFCSKNSKDNETESPSSAIETVKEENSAISEKVEKEPVVSTETSKEETTSVSEETSSVSEEPAEETKEPEAEEEKEETNGVTPELKEFLDKYEEFFDEYIDFMKAYDSTDATMLLEYAQMLQKYNEFSATAEAYDSSTMSPADSAYYLEVMARVNKKLADAAIAIQ